MVHKNLEKWRLCEGSSLCSLWAVGHIADKQEACISAMRSSRGCHMISDMAARHCARAFRRQTDLEKVVQNPFRVQGKLRALLVSALTRRSSRILAKVHSSHGLSCRKRGSVYLEARHGLSRETLRTDRPARARRWQDNICLWTTGLVEALREMDT
jgi:hypothetical protein